MGKLSGYLPLGRVATRIQLALLVDHWPSRVSISTPSEGISFSLRSYLQVSRHRGRTLRILTNLIQFALAMSVL